MKTGVEIREEIIYRGYIEGVYVGQFYKQNNEWKFICRSTHVLSVKEWQLVKEYLYKVNNQ